MVMGKKVEIFIAFESCLCGWNGEEKKIYIFSYIWRFLETVEFEVWWGKYEFFLTKNEKKYNDISFIASIKKKLVDDNDVEKRKRGNIFFCKLK